MKYILPIFLASITLVGFGCTKNDIQDTGMIEPVIENFGGYEEIPTIDSDGDGITNYDEIELYQTDPYNADTDGDGYTDDEEIAGGYDPNEPATTESVHTEETAEQDGLTVNIDVDAEVTTNTSCGADASCMDETLETCAPATMMADAGFAVVEYEITGEANDGCAVTMIYTENPNPEWENQPLYCVAQQNTDFESSMQAALNSGDCTGPLAEIMAQ